MSIVAAYAVPHPPLIVPAIGGGREQEISHTIAAYQEVARRIAKATPDTLVISSPHTEMYLDYLHIAGGTRAQGTFAQFGASHEGSSVTYDCEFVRELCQLAQTEQLPAGTAGERDPSLDWGILVPLHFIQAAWEEVHPGTVTHHHGLPQLPCKVVRMVYLDFLQKITTAWACLCNKLREARAARCLCCLGRSFPQTCSGRPYGFAPEGPLFDELAGDVFRTGDFLKLLTADPSMCERAAECGLRSFQIMAGALDRTPIVAELLSHEGLSEWATASLLLHPPACWQRCITRF